MKEQILKLTCKKHIKIYKLHQLGLSNREIAEAVGSNSGHVYNALKDYQTKPEKVKTADELIVTE
jgi:IS30 family transposase